MMKNSSVTLVITTSELTPASDMDKSKNTRVSADCEDTDAQAAECLLALDAVPEISPSDNRTPAGCRKMTVTVRHGCDTDLAVAPAGAQSSGRALTLQISGISTFCRRFWPSRVRKLRA